MTVREIMTQEPAFCTPETSLKDVAGMMVACDCGEIPVVDQERKPIGAVTDRDITVRTVAEGKNPLELTAADCMSVPCITVRTNASLAECCQLLKEHQLRRIVVVDDSNRLCGIVSQADIAEHAPPQETASVVKEVSQAA